MNCEGEKAVGGRIDTGCCRPTSRWSRPTNREFYCCRFWLCVMSFIVGSVVSPVGGLAPVVGRHKSSFVSQIGICAVCLVF